MSSESMVLLAGNTGSVGVSDETGKSKRTRLKLRTSGAPTLEDGGINGIAGEGGPDAPILLDVGRSGNE